MSSSELNWGYLVQVSFAQPRTATRLVTGLQIAPAVLWQALLAVMLCSLLFEYLVIWLSGGVALPLTETDPMTLQLAQTIAWLYANPMLMAAVQLALLWAGIVGIHQIGRVFGGTSHYHDVLAMMAWFQVLTFGLQLLQIVVMLALPSLSGMVGIGTLVAFFYLLTMFVTELHGFRAPGMVFLGIMTCGFAILVALAVVTVTLSTVFVGGPGNV